MKEKKHIDQLFKDTLEDFEVTPREAVWENIQENLNKKEKRRVIPIWIRFSGVAAGLILLLVLGNSIINLSDASDASTPEVIVDTKESIDSPESEVTDSNVDSSTKTLGQNDESNTPAKNEAVVNSLANKKKIISQNKSNLKQSNAIKNSESIVQHQEESSKNSFEAITRRNQVNTDILIEEAISTENSLAKNEDIKSSDESVKIDGVSDNPLEETMEEVVLADNISDKESVEIDQQSKWGVATNIAPVYFNTLGQGSSIHSQFNNNTKSGDINLSYGIAVSYEMTNRLKLRMGVNKLQLGYSTNDVVVLNTVGSAVRSGQIENISFDSDSKNMAIISRQSVSFGAPNSSLASQAKGTIDQEFGFIEIPLELEYQILNRKIGARVIGGFSALFLDENNIYSVLDGQSTLLGNATNINKTSYSANFGIGLDYKLSQKFNLNFEPMFKYQLNTFENTSGDFQPYFIGFYSGIKFKF